MRKKLLISDSPQFTTEINGIQPDDAVHYAQMNAILTILLENDVALKESVEQYFGSSCDKKPELAEGLKADNLVEAINEVFMLGSENKRKLAENLTAKGVQASTDDTWGTLLDKILDMVDTSKDTVTAVALLSGYTTHDASGEQITGSMPELVATTVDATSVTQDDKYTYFGLPEGHYSEDSKARALNSNFCYVVLEL